MQRLWTKDGISERESSGYANRVQVLGVCTSGPTEEIRFSDVCIKAIALFNSQGFQEINFSFQTIDTKTSLSFLLCCFCGCAFHVTLLNLKLYWRRWTKGYMKVCHLSPSRKLKVLESLSLWIYSLNNVIINAALSIPQTLPFQFLCNLPS